MCRKHCFFSDNNSILIIMSSTKATYSITIMNVAIKFWMKYSEIVFINCLTNNSLRGSYQCWSAEERVYAIIFSSSLKHLEHNNIELQMKKSIWMDFWFTEFFFCCCFLLINNHNACMYISFNYWSNGKKQMNSEK